MSIYIKYTLAAYALIVSVGHCDATINYDIVSMPGAYSSTFTPKNSTLFSPAASQDSSSGLTTGVDLQKLALVTSVSHQSNALTHNKSAVSASTNTSTNTSAGASSNSFASSIASSIAHPLAQSNSGVNASTASGPKNSSANPNLSSPGGTNGRSGNLNKLYSSKK